MAIVAHFRINQLFRDIGLFVLIALIMGAISYLFAHLWGINLIPILSLLLLYGVWPSLWRIFPVFFLHQPALIINDIGIEIFPPHIPSKFFIGWSEIQRISVDQDKSGKYICVYYKDKKEYFSHLSPFKHFIAWFWNPKGRTVMLLSLRYVDKPAVEIFQQIAHEYANELHEHDIQLQL